ncbi:hypothetical protein [Tritonibacter scottomollicae]|uniref:hypothetical protein n=1 Tax=Tritonibacter scottomollicae TaxID=483013 RepID=UPI003BAD80EC
MSWTKKVLFALCAVFALQLTALAVMVLPDLFRSEPSVAVFDPERSLTMFVIWSNGRVDDAKFERTLPVLQQSVQMEINRLTAETGQLVVRKDAILSQSRAASVDVTETIMQKVLTDAAF